MRRIGVGVVLLVAAWPVWAEALTLDFRQAIDMALRQNPDLLSAQAQIAQAQAGVSQAEGARLPKITATVGATRTNDALNAFGMKLSQRQATFNDFGANQFTGPESLGVAPNNLNDPGWVNNFSTRLEAQLPLYTGGKLQGYRQQARSMLLAAQSGDVAARQQIIARALQAYDGVYTARAFQGVAAKALEAAQSQVKTVDSLLKQGVVIKSDLLSAQVRLEDVKLQQEQAGDMEAQAMDALHVALGLPLTEKIELGPEVQVSLPAGSPDSWIGQALENNPQIQALRQQIQAASGKVEVARSELYPQVGALARVDTADPSVGFSAHSYTIGAQLTWNVFDGGVARQGVDQAVAQRMEMQAKLQSAENQLGMQIQDSYRKALDAQNQLKTRALAVQQSEEAARIVSKRYANGVGTLVEVQGAQAQLDKARADLVLARNQINMQRAALRLALGQLTLDGLQPVVASATASVAASAMQAQPASTSAQP
ncbi:putative Integral outer membrane protein TolC, efflux pump component [Thiomonas sp. X19]|nr:putative Integral outer membrane protein TolC, efflux pump component [Thiomonas sp. X19]